MCFKWLLGLFSLRNGFKFICILLTLFLICQELLTLVVIKPTATSKEEKELKSTDLPEVVICLEPGFDSEVLEGYGYKTRSYYRGTMDWWSKFIGWNGKKDGNKSSREILNEALIVKRKHINSTKFIESAQYNGVYVKVELRTLAYPFGRCFSISPPSPQRSDTLYNWLSLHFNFKGNVFKKYKGLKIMLYFMDKTNSLQIYPDENDIAGYPLKFELEKIFNKKSTYKTKISRSKHVEGDPVFECTEYTSDNSYNDCIQNEVLDHFHELLGCQPPLLGKDSKSMCNERFNVSKAKERQIHEMFEYLFQHNVKFKCKAPCTTNKYTTSLLHTISQHEDMVIKVVFDRTLEVTRSTFSINSQTFLTSLGGSVSSGRTLLWILVTLLGASQVISKHFRV